MEDFVVEMEDIEVESGLQIPAKKTRTFYEMRERRLGSLQ